MLISFRMTAVIILVLSCFLSVNYILAAKHQYLDECVKTTGVKITPDILKQIHEANKGGAFDMNSIPEEMLCLPKCILEKREIIDLNGKISTENLKNDPIMNRIPDKNAFLDCLNKIEKIEVCGDMKKMLQCRIDSQ